MTLAEKLARAAELAREIEALDLPGTVGLSGLDGTGWLDIGCHRCTPDDVAAFLSLAGAKCHDIVTDGELVYDRVIVQCDGFEATAYSRRREPTEEEARRLAKIDREISIPAGGQR